MPKWIGNRFGDIVPIAPGEDAPSGMYNMFDQYYSKQDEGWVTPVSMTGGTAFGPVTIDGAERMVCRFRSPGTLTIAAGDAPSARILVVGGGGAGGSFNPGAYGGGGGGGGGVRYVPSISLPAGTYPISVGDGGTGGNPYSSPGNGGTPAQPKGGGTSSIFNPGDANGVPAITATGGGGGGVGGTSGNPGGSGGGKSYPGGGGAGRAGGEEPRANPTHEGNPSSVNKSSTSSGSYGCGGGGGANPTHPNKPYQRGNPGLALPGVGSPGDPWLPTAGNEFGGGGGGSSYKETDGNGAGGPGGGGDAPGNDGAEYSGGGGGGIGSPNGVGGDGGYGTVYVIIPKIEVNVANPGPGA